MDNITFVTKFLNFANLIERSIPSDIDLSVDVIYRKLYNVNASRYVANDDICCAHFNVIYS